MNSKLRPFVAASMLAAAGTFNSGCADNNATLFIQGVIALEAPECVYKPDPAGTFFGSGTLDVAFRRTYEAGLLVGNQYTPRGDKENLRAETTRVNLRGAEVQLTDEAGEPKSCPGADDECRFSVYGSGFANSSRGAESGYGIFIADLIPARIGEQLGGEVESGGSVIVIATVRVFGDTTGGQEIESGALTFPIRVCHGCLVNFPPEAIDPAQGNLCVAATDSVGDPPCNKGQDNLVDCRLCAQDDVNWSICGGRDPATVVP